MIRTCFAALVALGGMASFASAQVFTSYDSPAYTTYYHSPAYSYSNYNYSSGYGPLGLVNWGWRRGMPYTGAYTAGYAPASYYTPMTSYYAPMTSYYAPAADTTLAYYGGPTVASACCAPTPCCSSCCSSCSPCSSCSSGSCPGGNCSLNYSPTDLSPRPDPASSGSRTIESESNGSGGTNSGTGGTNSDNWNRPADGYNGASERGAGYPPQTKIEKKAPTNVGNESAPEAADDAAPDAAQDAPADAAENPQPEADESFKAPGAGSATLLDLDHKVTAVPSIVRHRLALRARFQSPSLARADVDAKSLHGRVEMRLVRN
jgi:hypothetical protein